MIRLIIISGVLFVLGNAFWWVFNEPKLNYIPQAVFFISLILFVKNHVTKKVHHIFLEYLLLLSYGNLVKQVFYSNILKQVNDYIWGGLVTIYLIYKLIKWATNTSQQSGRKFYKAQKNL